MGSCVGKTPAKSPKAKKIPQPVASSKSDASSRRSSIDQASARARPLPHPHDRRFDNSSKVVHHEPPPRRRSASSPASPRFTPARYPPRIMPDMKKFSNYRCHFMIQPFEYDPNNHLNIPVVSVSPYEDHWDGDHVLMPCSPKNILERKQFWQHATRQLHTLEQCCLQKAANFDILKRTLFALNPYISDLKNLEETINEALSLDQRRIFLYEVLPKMCRLVLDIENICGESPPLLKSGSTKAVTMSQYQAASLLACAFFCLFPERSHLRQGDFFYHYPDINFIRLYGGEPRLKVQKILCLINYFKRVTTEKPTGVITIRRICLKEKSFPDWKKSGKPLTDLIFLDDQLIDDIQGALQVDFANKYLGGGVLGAGCVQEEIRLITCPEMLVGLLLCERMDDNECIVLIGCQKYAAYTGYAKSFHYSGNFVDRTPKDSWGRVQSYVVAIDALFFPEPEIQYDFRFIRREIDKAYVGFYTDDEMNPNKKIRVATGNWGCGAFNGDRQLKGIIQLLSASEAERPMIFTTMYDRQFRDEFERIYKYLKQYNATVGDLYKYLLYYSQYKSSAPLFDVISNTNFSQIRKM